MKKKTDAPLRCEICDLPFEMGDTIYPLRVSPLSWDLCEICKDDIVMTARTMQREYSNETKNTHETAN